MCIAVAGAGNLPADQRSGLEQPAQRAVTSARLGRMTESEWSDLAAALSVAEQLASRHGIASDRMPQFQAALRAMADLWDRYQARGRFVLRGPELTAIADAVELYSVQLYFASTSEIRAAFHSVRGRTLQAAAGRAQPGARVVGLDSAAQRPAATYTESV